MNRIHQVFAALALVLALANQGCNGSSAPTFTGTAPRQFVLKFENQPQGGLPGEPIALKVSMHTPSGALSQAAGSVTIAFAANPTGATLAGTLTRPAVNGIATFDDVAVSAPGQDYTLIATAASATPATSAAFTLAYSMDEGETTADGRVIRPNDTLATAVAIAPNVPMFGNLSSPDDLDFYKFHALAGQILSVSSYATRLDLADWDTSLRLRLQKADGTEIQRFDAPETIGATSIDNGFTAVRIPADGDYYLACDLDASGNLNGNPAKYALVVKLADAPVAPQAQTGANTSIASAQVLSPGVLYGQYNSPADPASTNDSYFYELDVTGPTHLHLDLVGGRNGVAGNPPDGTDSWDAMLELLDSDGTTVLWKNDDAWFTDPVIDYIVTPEAGPAPTKYYVRVTRYPTNTSSSPYTLSYQASPYTFVPAPLDHGNTSPGAAMPVAYDQDVRSAFDAAGDQYFKFGGKAGDVVRLWVQDETHLDASALEMGTDPALPAGTFNGDAVLLDTDGVSSLASSLASSLPGADVLNVRQTILQADGTYYVHVKSNDSVSGSAIGQFGIRVEKVASAASDAGWFAGRILVAGDKGHHTVHAEKGQLVTVSLYAGQAPSGIVASPFGSFGSDLLPKVEVFDPQATLVSSTWTDRPGANNFAESVLRPDAMLETSFRAPVAGDYDVVVSEPDGAFGPTLFYALQVWKNQ